MEKLSRGRPKRQQSHGASLMQINVFAIGRRMPGWVEQACADYSKRLPKRWQFNVRELAQAQGATGELIMAKEAGALMNVIPEKSHVVALDNRGKAWSTEELASQLDRWQTLGKNISLVIGGADGLHESVRQRADQQWSLSALTFPHPLVRIILLEQLYRAQSLLDNHPYHRA